MRGMRGRPGSEALSAREERPFVPGWGAWGVQVGQGFTEQPNHYDSPGDQIDPRKTERPSRDGLSGRDQVFMIAWPALRFLTRPRPPGALAARFFAAVI